MALHICSESWDLHFAGEWMVVWLDTPACWTSRCTEKSEILPHMPGAYVVFPMTASHTLSVRFIYSGSPNHTSTPSKSPSFQYPDSIRAATNTTKLYRNRSIFYKNNGSCIIHLGIYDMFRPKECTPFIIITFFRIKIKLWKIKCLKVIL